MVRTHSTMLSIGTVLPSFDLPVVKETASEMKTVSEMNFGNLSNSFLDCSKPVLLMIICAHCPFVKHIEKELTKLEKDYGEHIQMIAIASNSLITHPQDAPVHLAKQAKENGWQFPYLLDLDQRLSKALKAACTPDFFLFSSCKAMDKKLRLVYRGRLDSSTPGNRIPLTGEDLRAALDAVLLGKTMNPDQQPSIGCNIKWHPGKEPAWFI